MDSSTASRQTFIDAAFNKFVRDDQNSIQAADLKPVYMTKLHPKVVSGQCSEDEVFLEFLTHFGDKSRDDRINRAEWNKYYQGISATVPVDEHFGVLMAQVWQL